MGARDPENIFPKRFGLKYDPPQVVLEYLEPSTGKLFHRVMGLRKLKPDTNSTKVAAKLKEKNQPYLADDKVSLEQIKQLVERLQEGLVARERDGNRESSSGGGVLTLAPAAGSKLENSLNNKIGANDNTLSNNTLRIGGGSSASSTGYIGESSKSNDATKKASPTNIYDRGLDFFSKTNTSANKAPNKNPTETSFTASSVGSTHCGSARFRKGSSDDNEDFGNNKNNKDDGDSAGGLQDKINKIATDAGARDVDYSNFDLNKLGTAELSKHKTAMDEVFYANQKKADDPDFVYDLREDFDVVEKVECGWDSGDDD